MEHMGSERAPKAIQRVIKVRRDYNTWVANETLEDYALRFTPRSLVDDITDSPRPV